MVLQINGPVSVERVDAKTEEGHNVLIMGPTGAGKSTFIEALGFNASQKISSNGLEGFTQTLTPYSLVNATYQDAKLYLLDSPGFADPKISDLAIISMVKNWLEQKEGTYFSHILFLTPISHVRLSGSRRQVLRTFQALTGLDAAQNVVIVTTMWDSIGSDNAMQRSESTYKQLQDDACKGFTQKGARVLKFLNNQESALSILNDAVGWPMRQFFVLESMGRESHGIKQSPFARDLYNDLKDRILSLRLQQGNLQSDLALELESEADREEMKALLIPKLEEIERDIARFTQELADFGPMPGIEASNSAILDPGIGSLSDVSEVAQTHESVNAPLSPSFVLSPSFPPVPPIPPHVDEHLLAAPRFEEEKRRRISQIIRSMRCWGRDILENHEG